MRSNKISGASSIRVRIAAMGEPKIMTKLCHHYFGKGCQRGRFCTYAHSDHEIGEVCYLSNWPQWEQTHKMIMCRNWLNKQPCKTTCQFAHGPEEMGQPKNDKVFVGLRSERPNFDDSPVADSDVPFACTKMENGKYHWHWRASWLNAAGIPVHTILKNEEQVLKKYKARVQQNDGELAKKLEQVLENDGDDMWVPQEQYMHGRSKSRSTHDTRSVSMPVHERSPSRQSGEKESREELCNALKAEWAALGSEYRPPPWFLELPASKIPAAVSHPPEHKIAPEIETPTKGAQEEPVPPKPTRQMQTLLDHDPEIENQRAKTVKSVVAASEQPDPAEPWTWPQLKKADGAPKSTIASIYQADAQTAGVPVKPLSDWCLAVSAEIKNIDESKNKGEAQADDSDSDSEWAIIDELEAAGAETDSKTSHAETQTTNG